uniref:Uncharacterized protein n=1 Tax=Plectus sambesii TaxID=2011161 RepID=A0A914UZ42_9BILA
MSSGPTRVQPLPVDYQRSAVCSAPSSPLTQSRPPPVNDGSLRAPNYDGGSRGSAQQKRNFFETLALRSSQPTLNHRAGPIDLKASELSDDSTTPTPETLYQPLVEEEYDSPFKATLHQIQSMKEDDFINFDVASGAASDGSPDRNTAVSGYDSVAGDFAGGAESTMSDHPSLATASIDLDANDGCSRATEAEASEDDALDQAIMDLSQRSDANVLELSYHPEETEKESTSKSKTEAEMSVSSSTALSDLSRGWLLIVVLVPGRCSRAAAPDTTGRHRDATGRRSALNPVGQAGRLAGDTLATSSAAGPSVRLLHRRRIAQLVNEAAAVEFAQTTNCRRRVFPRRREHSAPTRLLSLGASKYRARELVQAVRPDAISIIGPWAGLPAAHCRHQSGVWVDRLNPRCSPSAAWTSAMRLPQSTLLASDKLLPFNGDASTPTAVGEVLKNSSNNNRAVNGGPSFPTNMTSSYAGLTAGEVNTSGASRSQSIPPLLSPTSPVIRGYTPINFAPPVSSNFQQFTASSRPAPPTHLPFNNATVNSSSNNGYSDLSASSSSAVRLPPPLSSSSTTSERQAPPTFVAPPPPPTSASNSRPKWEVRTEATSTASTPNEASDGRSSIEVPDRQSVASLRSQIANKLNGAPAIKHRPDSATGSESETRSEPQTPHTPGRIEIPTAVAASKGGADDRAPTVAEEIAGSHNFAHLRRPGRKEAPPVTAMPSLPTASDDHRPFSPPIAKEAGEPSRPPPPAHVGPSEASVWGHQRQFGLGRSPELRGSSVPVHAEASPPLGAAFVERKSSIEGNQVRTENFYDFPKDYYNTFTSRRPVMRSQPDRRYAYREGRTAQQNERQTSPGDPEPSHSWYKMMYKKLHQLDHPEEQSVLKYRMRDYKSPARQTPRNAAHLYNKESMFDSSPSQSRINYKLSDSALEQRDFDRAYEPASFGLSPMRTYRDKEEYNSSSRVVRSKSAGRFDDRPVKATSSIESQYRVQPSRIENYVPGASSLARYEEEDSTFEDDAISVKTDTEIVDRWRMERRLLADPVRQRSQSRLDDRYEMISSRYRFDTDGLGQAKSSRRDFDPSLDDVQSRLQYRAVQSGGEVPIGGLRHPTSERNDSYGLTGIFAPKKEPPRASRDSAVQASLNSLSHAPSATNPPSHNFSALTVRTDMAPLPLRQRQPLSAGSLRPKHGSPVACTSRSTGLYAYERAKASDFHIPPYLMSPERRQQPCKSHNLAVLQAANRCRICGKSWRDFAWDEVEAFFKLLDRTDQATSTRGDVLTDESDVWFNHAMEKRHNVNDIKTSSRKKPCLYDAEYATICAHLDDVVKDIEAFRLGLRASTSQTTSQAMDRSSSFPEGLNGGGGQ